MSALNAYLFFNGNCAEAMRFYERTLDAKIEMMMTHGEVPTADRHPSQDDSRIVHARLVGADGMVLLASDSMAGEPYAGMRNFSLSLNYSAVTQAKRIFDALADGGEVRMPFDKTFWSAGFGMLADRYGTPWMVSGEHA